MEIKNVHIECMSNERNKYLARSFDGYFMRVSIEIVYSCCDGGKKTPVKIMASSRIYLIFFIVNESGYFILCCQPFYCIICCRVQFYIIIFFLYNFWKHSSCWKCQHYRLLSDCCSCMMTAFWISLSEQDKIGCHTGYTFVWTILFTRKGVFSNVIFIHIVCSTLCFESIFGFMYD